MKILVYSQVSLEQQAILEDIIGSDHEVVYKSDLNKDELVDYFARTSILVGNPPVTFFNNPHPKLKFWQIDSAGFNQYQKLKVNFPVANMGTFFADRCAETIVSGAVAFYRGIHQVIRLQQEKLWKGNSVRKTIQSVARKSVLILGAGAIGLSCKRMLIGFDCNIMIAARRNPIAQLHNYEDVLNILPSIDLVINTLPGTATNYVSSQFISAMKEGSVYANVGRGNTTDEEALIEALKSSKLAGAILDVTEIEPLPSDHILWEMDNVILTQHSGGGDVNEAIGKVKQIVANVDRFIKHQPLKDVIELNKGY